MIEIRADVKEIKSKKGNSSCNFIRLDFDPKSGFMLVIKLSDNHNRIINDLDIKFPTNLINK